MNRITSHQEMNQAAQDGTLKGGIFLVAYLD